MLACLLPTPEGQGWRYPWMRSKASLHGDGDYYNGWNAEGQQYPYQYPYQNGQPMMLGIPTFPMPAPPGMYGPPPPQHPKSRSTPNVWDRQPSRGLGGGGYQTSRRRSSSNVTGGSLPHDVPPFDRDLSPPQMRRNSALSDRRSSLADFENNRNGSRRRSSEGDPYGFL